MPPTRRLKRRPGLAPLIDRYPDAHDIVVDIYAWTDGPLGDGDETADEITAALDSADWSRPVRRVVVALSYSTVTLLARLRGWST
jgi:hypothetical protein